MIPGVLEWLSDPAHWTGPDGVPARTLQHVWYSAVALLIASVVAVPAGLLIGHTGRGRFLVVNLAGAARAIPSLGLLFIMWQPPALWLCSRLEARGGKLGGIVPKLRAALGSLRVVAGPSALLIPTLLSVVAWGAEGVALYVLLVGFGQIHGTRRAAGQIGHPARVAGKVPAAPFQKVREHLDGI